MADLVYTGESGYRSRSLGRVEPGDTHTVSGDLEAHLLDRGDWEHVESERCGVEMSDGSTCDRPADECPYHQED